MNKVLREEKKFLISVADFIKLSHKVEQVMLSDPHNGTHGYMIRSLYFDTPFDDDYFEKQAGIELRRKVRLRCYDPNSDFAMLELKQKQGAQQMKRSLKVSREDAKRLIAGDYSVLLNYTESFAAEMYGLMQYRCYRPKTIVEYNRKATYNRLQAEFRLNSYLYDINSQAEEMFETLIKQFKQTEGITEQLKSEKQMEWVCRMNNIRQMATEIVISELIYN